MKLAGLIILIIFTIGGLIVVDNFAYISLPALLIVVGLTIGGLITSFGIKVFNSLKTIFGTTDDKNEIHFALIVLKRTRSYLIASGAIGTMIGHVLMLATIEYKSAIFLGLSTGYIPLLYALFFAFVTTTPFIHELKQRVKHNNIPQTNSTV